MTTARQSLHLNIFISNSEQQVDDFVGELTFQNSLTNTLCEIKSSLKCLASSPLCPASATFSLTRTYTVSLSFYRSLSFSLFLSLFSLSLSLSSLGGLPEQPWYRTDQNVACFLLVQNLVLGKCQPGGGAQLAWVGQE